MTAAIIVPSDDRAETILFGRADAGLLDVQLVRASEVVDRLLVEVFRIRRTMAVLGVAAIDLLLVLVALALSIRIRAAEIET